MIVLLPPSEGKAEGGRGRLDVSAGPLGPKRQAVADAMVDALAAGSTSWPKLFGVGGPLAERAAVAWHEVAKGAAPGMPAWKRFTGVVWAHLDPATLPAGSRRSIVVPNALLGACRGDEQVPDFRLKLSVALGPLGRLDRWWRDDVTEAIASTGRGPVVDLLPNEHASAVDWAALGASRKVVRIRFVAAGGGAAAGHAAKAVKGIVARAALLDGLGALDGLAWEGWRSASSPDGFTVTAPRVVPPPYES